MYWIVCSVVLSFAHICYSQANITVTTSKGAVMGLQWNPNPKSGAVYDAFLGIPYGQISARFQPAIPRSSWNYTLVAQSDSPACPQPTFPLYNQPTSEDCLFLNVFTPANASLTPRKFPVMAFIPGGAFTIQTSSSLFYGPDFIVPQGVVLVTMNYRVGAAGFLTLGTPEAPGNLGLLDTQLALSWIQKEIAVFGGDPGNVTLAGQSAGSVMTMFHYLSPVSSAMFQRAIAHSGSALSTWGHVTQGEAVRRARLLADAAACDTSMNTSQILSCLQKKDINTIVTLQNISLPVESVASGNQLSFVPVIDTSFGQPPFFNDSLSNLLKQAAIRSKPLITGFTTEEGILLFAGSSWTLVQANLGGFVPWRVETSLSASQKKAMQTKIGSKYFPNTLDRNNVLDIVNVYTDYMFAYPTIDEIKQLSNSTYGYVFAYHGPWAPVQSYFQGFHVTGVCHGDDLSYLFYAGQDLGTCVSNSASLTVKDNMVKWWTNFIKTGVPDPSGTWTPVSTSGKYLLIDSTVSTINASQVEDRHYNFWADLSSSLSSSALSSVKANFSLISAVLFYISLKCVL